MLKALEFFSKSHLNNYTQLTFLPKNIEAMSKKDYGTISSALCFAVVLIVLALLAVLSVKPVNMAVIESYKSADNLLGIENAQDCGYYGDYLDRMFVVAEGSPVGPEAAY